MTLESDAATKCYRFSTAKRNLFTVLTLSFFAMAVLSAYFFYFDGPVKATRVYAAVVIGGFWFAMTLLSAYLVALYHRGRLCVSTSEVRLLGVFSDRIANVSRIDELKWSKSPADGSVRLRGRFQEIKVDFGNFAPSDRAEIIAFFRDAIDDTRQIGRREFDAYYFPDASERAKRIEASRRGLRLSAMLFLLISVGSLIAWFITGKFGPLFGVAVNLAASAYFWNSGSQLKATEVAHSRDDS